MATGRRRGRAIIYVLLIFVLIAILAFAFLRFGQGIPGVPAGGNGGVSVVEETPTPIPSTIDIVVASQDIKRGQEITDDRITIVKIPMEEYTEGVFFQTKEEVIGARAIFDLKPATPITDALIIPPGEEASVPSFEIPRGMVAISIPMNKLSSVSYGLQKGDHVNVIASLLMLDLDTNFQSALPNRTGYSIAPGPITPEDDVTITRLTQMNVMPQNYSADPESLNALSYMGRIEIDPTSGNPVWAVPGEPQRPRLVSQTLIQDVIVLQLGYFDQAAGDAALPEVPAVEDPAAAPAVEDPAAAAPASPERPDIITLVVSPQDAITLNYLLLSGANLNMVLRSAGDDQRVDTEAVTLQFILDQYRIPNPAKLPYGLTPRMDDFPSYAPVFPEPGPQPTPIP